MVCYHPLKAYFGSKLKSGKRDVVFSFNDSDGTPGFDLPCGKCQGCRLERSRQWAVRCLHESNMFDQNCFITLTYNFENLPKDGSLSVDVVQKFFKRLRKKFPDRKIRYFLCGEYGDMLSRPHYHACLFGFDFDDKYLFR